MKPTELQALLETPTPPHLIHVLPPEQFASQCIPKSQNACIYLVAFDELATAAVPDRNARVVVYSLDGLGHEAQTAAERLTTLGYSRVDVLEGGLEAWTGAGFAIEGTGSIEVPPPTGIFIVNTETSLLRWTGRNLFNHHEGTLQLAAGRIELHEGALVSAAFDLDMRSIVCTDIPDESMRAALIRHLMHSDFFKVEHFPVAHFAAISAALISEATEGTPNVQVAGHLTLRGITRRLEFPAVVALRPDGQSLTAQAVIEVDRTEFGSRYGSGRFFRFLGQHVVNDRFHIHLKIHAAKDSA